MPPNRSRLRRPAHRSTAALALAAARRKTIAAVFAVRLGSVGDRNLTDLRTKVLQEMAG